MTRRGVAKASGRSAVGAARPAHAKASGSKAKSSAVNGLEERLAQAERERDALREELERFKVRQRQLEEAQAHVCDRIAWALDSLHNILEGKA
jgi:DNA repair exonuclease SbcCD ATPase subunit